MSMTRNKHGLLVDKEKCCTTCRFQSNDADADPCKSCLDDVFENKGHTGYQERSAVVVMGNEDLAFVIHYCRALSRSVSPAKAAEYWGFRHDGAVSDFLKDLAEHLEEGKPLNLATDEFCGQMFARIREDVRRMYGEGDMPETTRTQAEARRKGHA